MSPKDIALLYRHPLLVLNFYWLSERYHAAHYICHVQQQRQAELSKQDLIALIDHYMRMSASEMLEEMEHVQPCDFCDIEQLFGSKNRRAHHERAAA
jgi:hypothetical protein